MLDLVKQIIEFYFKNLRTPKLEELEIKQNWLLERKGSVFVTLYISWVVRGSSWNIKEIEENMVLELIQNTVQALQDSRFSKIKLDEKNEIKVRIDEISDRWRPLNDWEIKKIDPTKNGILLIKTNYEKACVILPNISGSLISWEDFIPVLGKKLGENFDDKNYLVYKIETDVVSDLW